MIKIKSLFPAVCVILLSILFISCGKDSVTGGNGNPPPSNETLIYSFDLYEIIGTGEIIRDTIIDFTIVNTDSLKVTFSLETNCDTLDNPLANISFGTFGLNINAVSVMNQYHTYYASCSDSFFLALYLKFNTLEQRFFRFRNVRLYKIL